MQREDRQCRPRIKIYRDHQLTAVEQPGGLWAVEIVPVGGYGRPFMTQAHGLKAGAFAFARAMLDNGVTS